MGITGNEEADRLASEATEGSPAANLRISISYLKELRKNKRIWRWKRQFCQGDLGSCAHFKEHCKFTVQSLRLPKQYVDNKRRFAQALVSARCGKGYFGDGYYHGAQRPVIKGCPCRYSTESVKHIIQQCPRFSRARVKLKDFDRSLTLKKILDTSEGLDALFIFVKELGAFLPETFFSSRSQCS